MIKEVFEKQTETESREEKIDTSIFKKRSSAHSFQGWMVGKIKQARNNNKPELVALLIEIYNKYMEFGKYETKNLIEVEIIEGWKGIDNIELFDGFTDDFVIKTHSKDKETGEVSTQTHQIKRELVNRLFFWIKQWKIGESHECYDFAPKLGFNEWKDLWRERDVYFNSYYYPVKILEALGFIKYSGRGVITRIK